METDEPPQDATGPYIVFELPMRDGNQDMDWEYSQGLLVFELPMRDGNSEDFQCLPNGFLVFELPMRDGN